jgi:hypothetical protein
MIDREEIDNALKKRIHTIQEPVIGTFNGNNVDVTHEHALSKKLLQPHMLQVMHDLMDYAHSDVVLFLRVGPGTQSSREK